MTIDASEVAGTVTHALARMAGHDPADIGPRTRLFEDLAFDSTGVLELLIELETSLGIEFDAETLEPTDFETVDSLVNYVSKQLQDG